jgi:carbamoyl-phosphate synthase/aspartate carbamoyltransferase/dihydroorotase
MTSQNHSFPINTATWPQDSEVLFTNANDQTNEGIIHSSFPYFSVQFHPEHTAGIQDLECVFDVFLDLVENKNKQRLC